MQISNRIKVDAEKGVVKILKRNKNKYENFSFRIYYLLNDNSGIKKNNGYFVIGNLYDLLKNENIKI